MHASLTVRKLIMMMIIIIIAVVSIARCVADMGEHSALYEVNKKVHIKTRKTNMDT